MSGTARLFHHDCRVSEFGAVRESLAHQKRNWHARGRARQPMGVGLLNVAWGLGGEQFSIFREKRVSFLPYQEPSRRVAV